MTRVTVLLPVHNGEAYIDESVASVLAQDLPDFELLVLDSGADSTGTRVRAIMDERVRYIACAPGTGLFAKLNMGLREARSELVRLWTHDDRMLPGSLRRFVEFAERHPAAALVYSDFHAIDAQGRRTGADRLHGPVRARTPTLASPKLASLMFFCLGCMPGNIATVLVRSRLLLELGGFDEGLSQDGDYEMWVRLSERHSVGFIAEKLVEVRDHPQQLSKTGNRHMVSIREDHQVFRQMVRQLEGLLTPGEVRTYWQEMRGRQHMHWIARALLAGNAQAALTGLKYLRAYDAPGRQLYRWLRTVNGRFKAFHPLEFFDRIRIRLEQQEGRAA